jgi:hypothetical protein
MPYFDLDEEQQTPDAEAEARRKVLGMIAGAGKKPVLGQPATAESLTPGSRGYDISVGATSQPRIPEPKVTPVTPPFLGSSVPSGRTSVLGNTPEPVRPNVAPTRGDFPAKPELGGWKKYLGLGAGFALGSAPLVRDVLHGQRDTAEKNYQRDVQDWERGQTDAARAATTEEAQARAESLRNPKPQKPENLDREAYDFYVSQGMSPAAARKQVLADAAEQKPDKAPNFEEASYQEWIKTHPGGTRLQFRKEYNPEKPEKPQRTLVTVPQPDGSAKVIEAQPGTTIPKGARTVTEFGKEQAPTADEQRRADLGNNLKENLAAYEDIVRRRPDLFGPVAGRATALKMMAGSSDPDISALRSIKEFAGMAAVGTHAMRNAQHVKTAADAMMNLYDDPNAILNEKGPLARARASIETFVGDVQGQRVQDKGDTVNVIAPDGTQGTIPRANLQKALARGYKQQ